MDEAANDTVGVLILCAVFVACAFAELFWPEHAPVENVGRRRLANLSLGLISSVLTMLPTFVGFGTAWFGSGHHVGVLDWFAVPWPLHMAIGLLALDVMQYALHRASHMIGPLWRFHAVHHSDPDVDVTTALRHHPSELLVYAVLEGGAVYLLGLTPTEVAVYAALAWVTQTLAHTNLALPPRLEAIMRWVVVTPRFHKIHHSRDQRETDTNYGEVLVIWDRLFRTLCPRKVAMAASEFGLDAFRDQKSQAPHWLLAQPFLKQR